jgi:hypothetical protein
MINDIKLKGGALYIAIIISILISIVLSLFISLAYYNNQAILVHSSSSQLQLSVESGFEISKSSYFSSEKQNRWQKMPYNNDSVLVKNLQWGCYQLVSVFAKNTHHRLSKTGLFGSQATPDTALMVIEQNRPIGLAGKIKFKGGCYLPKAGIKTAYIEGTSFSDLNALRPFIKNAPNSIATIDELFLKEITNIQSELNLYNDSLLSFIPENYTHSFQNKTAVVQQGSIILSSQVLSNNIKLIASNTITVDKGAQLNNVLLIARKIIFKKGFKGIVHAIAKDSIITEEECEFNYPSSFCVYNANSKTNINNNTITGVFFGETCLFEGSILACNAKNSFSKSLIKFNKKFILIGSAYSSNYCDAQGSLYGTVMCETVLLQTPSAVYENHLLNCLLDSKTYSAHLAVANWFSTKQKQRLCAKWF